MTSELTREDILILLIEECGEVIKAATKCLRFGYDVDHGIGYGNNADVLSGEIGDLLGCVDALPLKGEIMFEARADKIARATAAKHKFGVLQP